MSNLLRYCCRLSIWVTFYSLCVVMAGCTGGITYTNTIPSGKIESLNDIEKGADHQKKPSTETDEKSVVERVQHIPVPIPGQLMAIPTEEQMRNKNNKRLKEKEALKQAVTRGTIKPEADHYFNSMLVYNYMPGAVYTIYTSSGKVTDLILQKGEKIVNVAVGDSANWIIQTSYSGPESTKTVHVLVKPSILELADTTLTILTDRRTYHLFLRCTPNDVFMISVKWNYADEFGFVENSGGVLLSNKKSISPYGGGNVDVAHLDFTYSWKVTSSTKPAWLPKQIFNDGEKTYIRFPDNFKNMALPILYLPDSNGKWTTMTNWRFVNAKTMVVDAVISRALLKSGSVNGTQESIEITENEQ